MLKAQYQELDIESKALSTSEEYIKAGSPPIYTHTLSISSISCREHPSFMSALTWNPIHPEQCCVTPIANAISSLCLELIEPSAIDERASWPKACMTSGWDFL